MEFSVWLALFGLFLAGGLTPGPAVMLVVATSLRYGFRPSLLPALGITTANLVWIALAVSGAAVLAAKFPTAFIALKVVGCLFICWIAWGLIRKPPQGLEARASDAPKRSALFVRGVGLQLANPNALIYFGTLVPSYVDPARALPPQVAIMVVTICALEMFGLSVYARLADSLAQRFQNPTFARGFAVCAAVVMVVSVVYSAIVTR